MDDCTQFSDREADRDLVEKFLIDAGVVIHELTPASTPEADSRLLLCTCSVTRGAARSCAACLYACLLPVRAPADTGLELVASDGPGGVESPKSRQARNPSPPGPPPSIAAPQPSLVTTTPKPSGFPRIVNGVVGYLPMSKTAEGAWRRRS